MDDETYQAELAELRAEWGPLAPDLQMPGVLRAIKDPTTGILVGMRAPIIAEIVNRAMLGCPMLGGGWVDTPPKGEMFIWARPKYDGKWNLGLGYWNVSGGWCDAYNGITEGAIRFHPMPAPPRR